MPVRRVPALDRFQQSQSGTVAIIFATCAFALVMIAGLAIDVGRAYHANQKVSDALDAAALAAARAMRSQGLSNAEVQVVAEKFFAANIDGTGANYAVISALKTNIDRGTNSISLDVDSHVPTLFARIGGIEKFEFSRSAVAIYDTKDIEVGLQLDVTGSMSGSKLRDLKTAVGDLVDILLPDEGTTNRVRIALAPYAAGVNAGSLAAAVSDGTAGRDGCVYERRESSTQATDAAPIGTAALKVRADIPGATACPSDAAIQPMTDDKALMKAAIRRYSANGSTAGHLGTAWAWYLLSPNWAPVLPAASQPAVYNDGRTNKVAILMTDGIYNTLGGVMYRDGSATSIAISQTAEDTCTAMKAKGIVVYTIGFQLDPSYPYAADTLRDCASSPIQFFRAEDGEQLRAAFRAIAAEINNLRLSN